MHGLKLGGERSLCFGADFFYTDAHPDQSRRPFFHEPQGSAAKYPSILKKLSGKITEEQLTALASNNVLRFLREHIG
jgi:membrane dipeptidase